MARYEEGRHCKTKYSRHSYQISVSSSLDQLLLYFSFHSKILLSTNFIGIFLQKRNSYDIVCFQVKRIFLYTNDRNYVQFGLISMQRTEMFCDFHPQKNHAKKRLNSTLWLLSKLPIGRAAQG